MAKCVQLCTVVMMSELFGSESKAKVYGILHTFLQENEDTTLQIRKFSFILRACML